MPAGTGPFVQDGYEWSFLDEIEYAIAQSKNPTGPDGWAAPPDNPVYNALDGTLERPELPRDAYGSWGDGLAIPLAIDLDGDGLETIVFADSDARYDLDGDGFLEKTSWISGDDGWLAYDAHRMRMLGGRNCSFGLQNIL